MRDLLLPVARQLTFHDLEEEYGGEFPCDYQDTYDLGVKDGRIELARELLTMLDAAEMPVPEYEEQWPHPPLSEAAIRVVNSMLVVIPEENILRDENDEI